MNQRTPGITFRHPITRLPTSTAIRTLRNSFFDTTSPVKTAPAKISANFSQENSKSKMHANHTSENRKVRTHAPPPASRPTVSCTRCARNRSAVPPCRLPAGCRDFRAAALPHAHSECGRIFGGVSGRPCDRTSGEQKQKSMVLTQDFGRVSRVNAKLEEARKINVRESQDLR
jgi:hypothetical protein